MFAGFREEDFDAYAEAKWRSNAFNRERLEVKQKLLDLGRDIAGALVSRDGAPLAHEVTVEHPALSNAKQVTTQSLFFARAHDARDELDRIMDRDRGIASVLEDPSPRRSHLALTVEVSFDHLFVGLELHADAAIDRRNLEAITGDDESAADLVARIAALGGEHELAVDGDRAPAATCDVGALRRAVAALHAPARRLTLGRDRPRAAAIAAGISLGDGVGADLAALLPVYQAIAWSRDNDHIAMTEKLRADEAAKRQRGIEVGDAVRIVSGMFAGRGGTVQEIDDKGTVKVLVGNVPLKMKTSMVQKR